LLTRIISSVVGLALLVLIVLSHQIVLGISAFIFSLIGIYEFYAALSKQGHKPIKPIGYIACLPVLLVGIFGLSDRVGNFTDVIRVLNYFLMAVYAVIIILLAHLVFLNKSYKLVDLAITVFGILYVPFLLSFIVLTRNIENGLYFIWFIFIGAWGTDTFAYFSGILFGKRKIIPEISPKKTVEGTIGGIFGCMAITAIYGAFINNFLNIEVPLYHLAILGALNGIISQIGDWSASAIKRYAGIKDFGKIIPGHGGVLDRFDSVLLIGPVIYFYFSFFHL